MSDKQPLWCGVEIPVIGVSGEFWSGKTLFGLTISPKDTLCFDVEKSSVSYLGLGFERRDLIDAVARGKTKYRPIELYEEFVRQVEALPVGKYRVIMLDPVSEIESGLSDWVEAHPSEFGRTRSQYEKAQGLFWADVKELWKSLIATIASRCECFVFVSHMRRVFQGGQATAKREPKGKETLFELASLYLLMERKSDAKGNIPAIPSAKVLKSRLSHTRVGDDGMVEVVPILPPRLPQATPAAIRQYILQPPNYSTLSDAERFEIETLSEDEKLLLRAQIAADERAAVEAKNAEVVQAEKRAERRAAEKAEKAGRGSQAKEQSASHIEAAAASAPVAAAASEPSAEKPKMRFDTTAKRGDERASEEQRQQFLALCKTAGISAAEAKAMIAEFGVDRFGDLTGEKALELIYKAERRLQVAEAPF